MLAIIMFILIGLKLDMMNGLYLALIVIDIIVWIIKFILEIIKIVLKIRNGDI